MALGEFMAQVFPFRAYRYSPARVAFERVLTQPYDKISPSVKEKYNATDPHNLIAIENGLGQPNDTSQKIVCTRAAAVPECWIDEGVIVTDPARTAEIQRVMTEQKLVIADGHHRYETALNYRDECRRRFGAAPDAPYERAMMTFINTRGEGVTILPAHRLVSGIGEKGFSRLQEKLAAYFDHIFHAFADEKEKK